MELAILQNKEDNKMMEAISSFLTDIQKGNTEIQINNFVLNDIEFPTVYGKYQQAKVELLSRWSRIVDLDYSIQEDEIKIKIKEREIEKEDDDLKKQLLKIESEKMLMGLEGKKASVNGILNEARIFWKVYAGNPQFHNLSPDGEYRLDAENWAKKTLNMPTIFEERYGGEYMKKALGDDAYKQYLEVRKKAFGLLPREMMNVKQIGDSEHSPTNQRLKGASKAKPKDCVPSLKIFKDALWSLSHTKPQQEQ